MAHALLDHLELCLIAGQEVVQLGDEALHGGDELDEPLGDEHGAEVVALGGSAGYNARYTVHDLVEREVVGLHLFGDDADVRVGLQGTLQGDADRPMSLMKCQYLRAELQSRWMFPITSE